MRVLPGAAAFKLYDTFGFPVDLTADMARERGIMAMERLMGLILTAIAIQMLLSGIADFVAGLR